MIAKIGLPLERRPVDGNKRKHFEEPSSSSRFLPGTARITLKILAIVFVVLFVHSQLWCEQRVRLALSAATTDQVVYPDDTKDKNPLTVSPHFSRYGEVQEELLGGGSLKVVPAVGRWGQASWTDAKASLGGVNAKLVCHLLRNNNHTESNSSSYPVVEQDSSRRPYKVLARPIGNREGVGEEYLAYSVARELGMHKIPTQSIISHPRKGHRGIINIQSMLEGVRLTFLDNWTNCLPQSKRTTRSTLKKSNDTISSFLSSKSLETDAKNEDTNMVDIGHKAQNNDANHHQWIRLQTVQTDPKAVMRICFRNYTLNNDDWRRWCKEHGPIANRKCRQQEIAQLIEMAMFDAVIHNEERLHVHQGKSNNVHWIWPTAVKGNGDPPALNPDDALQLVWIDHSHYTFMNKTKLGPDETGEMMQFFSDNCIFPGNLLRQVFANHPRPLSKRIMERLQPKLREAEKHGDGQASVIAARTLEVVDWQVQHLRAVVARCANQHKPPGVVHVMDYDSDSFL